MPKKWIQSALKGHKEGSLHRQLGVPVGHKIPSGYLSLITDTPVGKTARNPTQVGKRSVRVTGLLKKRAVLAKTLRGIKK